MKKVTATFTMTIDLTETIEETEKDNGEPISDLRDFAIFCMQEDLQDLSRFSHDVKMHTNVEITEIEEELKWCQVCKMDVLPDSENNCEHCGVQLV